MPNPDRRARAWSDWWLEMRALRVRPGMREDLAAAATVAAIALPLSMAIALASDVDPVRGLVAASVGGFVAALFGSSRLSISGPAAALAVLVGQLVDVHGVGGLFVVTCLAGAMQVAVGSLGLGALARLVPSSVVHGFTAGIGVVLVIGQLPRAFGLPAPDESHVVQVLAHVGSLLAHVDPSALALAAIVVLAMMAGPRLAPRVPFAFVGVAAATALAQLAGWKVETLAPFGGASSLFPARFPPFASYPALVGDALAVLVVGSLETLLTAQTVETPGKGERHEVNQELVGQGLANVASGLLGGIPVIAVLARSTVNARLGARTRRAAMAQAVLVFAFTLALVPFLPLVPVAALGGVLVAFGARMWQVGRLRALFREHRSDALIFVVTAGVIVAFDLLVGVQAGILAACVVTLLRLTRTSIRVVPAHDDEPHHVLVDGMLTFLATPKVDSLGHRLREIDVEPGLVVDVRHVEQIDRTLATHLLDALAGFAERGGRVVVLAPNAAVDEALAGALPEGVAIALTDGDVDAKLGRARRGSGRRRIAQGLARYRREVKPRIHPLASRLAAGQSPHTMLITCADSRVVPSLITGAGPGELFVVRNIGALMPPYGSDTLNDEGAALEYAIRVLGVRNLVVCAHSRCGAMTALCKGGVPDDLHALVHWAEGARAIAGIDGPTDAVDEQTRKVALRQLENLRGYPVVRECLERGELTVGAWFFDVEAADVLQWDETAGEWRPIAEG